MKATENIVKLLLLLSVFLPAYALAALTEVERWGIFEINLHGQFEGNPYK